MKVSLNWLGDFVEWTVDDPQEIARRITAHTAEVDDVERQGALLAGCCVGKVTNLRKHPDADKLSLCDVETDKGKKQIVCGGTNLRDGMTIAFAHVGCRVQASDGELFELTKAKIRGETSEGMICAAEELGLESRFPAMPDQGNRPVIDLGSSDADVGISLIEHLNLKDTILHIDNHAITHRADLFSQIGFARECVAIGIAKWKKEPDYPAPEFPKAALPFKLILDAEELVARYCSCLITIDGMGETPDWMKERLQAVGMRSISLPIDITNFVMLEVGVPMHSFDADDIVGDVHMRKAKAGEKITTLDSSQLTLPEGAFIFSDDKGVFDLVGIMGGLRSSTKESTRTIFLHSLGLEPVNIRRTINATGHRTDAGTLYEKGVPNITTQNGFYRAVQLFLDLVPGATLISNMENWGENGTPTNITLSVDYVNKHLGTTLSEKECSALLNSLGFDVESKNDNLSVTPPLWRLNDVSGSHDLIEEIGRIYGFDAIEATMPEASITPPDRHISLHQIRDALKESCFIEVMPLSLVSPALVSKVSFDPSDCEEIVNPLGEEMSLMQPSTLPGILQHAEDNLLHAEKTLQTFHIGTVFSRKEEHRELGALVANRHKSDIKNDPFLVLKRHITQALAAAGYEARSESAKRTPAYAHAGRCASLFVGDQEIGLLFEVHPEVRSRFDLPDRASAVLLNLDILFGIDPVVTVAQPLPQYPAIKYDVTFDLDQSQSAQAIIDRTTGSSTLLESVEIADLYSATPPKDGTYKLTLRFTYRSPERTLTEEEVKGEHQKLLTQMQK